MNSVELRDVLRNQEYEISLDTLCYFLCEKHFEGLFLCIATEVFSSFRSFYIE